MPRVAGFPTLALFTACIIGIACVSAAGAARLPAQAAPGWCWQPPGTALYIRDYLRNLTSNPNADSLTLRARNSFQLLQTAPDEVQIVSDDSLCSHAAHAHYQKQYADSLPVAPVFLIRVGSERFVLDDGLPNGTGVEPRYVYDKNWNMLVVIAR